MKSVEDMLFFLNKKEEEGHTVIIRSFRTRGRENGWAISYTTEPYISEEVEKLLSKGYRFIEIDKIADMINALKVASPVMDLNKYGVGMNK